jgi:hypothetical protein
MTRDHRRLLFEVLVVVVGLAVLAVGTVELLRWLVL